MKRYLIIALLLMGAILWVQTARLRGERAERRRVQSNIEVLTDSIVFYRTQSGRNAASRQVLCLRASELEQHNAQLSATVRELRLKTRRLEAAAMTATRTEVQITAPLEEVRPKPTAWEKYGPAFRQAADSVKDKLNRELFARPAPSDPAKVFHWSDRHVSVEGLIRDDSVSCHVISIDTLQQIIHRVPRRFLFIRWGTKAVRQEVVSSNPHTRIVYTQYIEIRRRKKKVARF